MLPDANVGSGFLRDYSITFDQRNGRLRLLPLEREALTGSTEGS